MTSYHLRLFQLKSMLEDIEDGELDYEEDGQAEEIEDLPDLPEYEPGTKKETASEDGEIVSDNEDEGEREEGEIRDEDEVCSTGYLLLPGTEPNLNLGWCPIFEKNYNKMTFVLIELQFVCK